MPPKRLYFQSRKEELLMKTETTADFILADSILSGAVIETRTAGYSFAHHLHSAVEIYRIVSGECYMSVGSETMHFRHGEFILILPNVLHSFYLSGDSDCTFIHVHFDPSLFAHIILEDDGICPTSLIHALLFSSRFYYRVPADSVLDGSLKKLLELQPPHSERFSGPSINVLLISMMLYLLNQNSTGKLAFSSHRNSYVAYTLNYIELNYMNKIKQEDIASQLQISVRYLSRLFKDYMGIPLSSYINIYRINRSIELMQDTDLTLTEIALTVGFSNAQHYSKTFISIINEPPSQYRKRLLK